MDFCNYIMGTSLMAFFIAFYMTTVQMQAFQGFLKFHIVVNSLCFLILKL